MSLRTLTLLIIATIVSTALAIYSVILEPKFSTVKSGGVVFPELVSKIDNVSKLFIRTNERTMTMVHNDGKWVLEESDGYLLEPSRVRSAILGFAGLRYAEPKTRKEENYLKLDLRNPSKKESRGRAVEIYGVNGEKLVNVILGRTRYNMPGTTKGGIYFRKGSKSQTWLGVGLLEISRSPEDWLQTAIVNIPETRIKEARFYHSDGETIIVKRLDEKNIFSLQDIPPGKKLKYDSDPRNMASVLQDFELEDVQKAGKIDSVGKKVVVGEFLTKDDLSITVHLVEITNKDQDNEEYWVRIKAKSENPSMKSSVSKINEHTAPWIFKIPSFKASRLNKRLKDLLEDKKPKA